MIEAESTASRYATRVSDGVHEAVADTTADKGGGASGFRPHDLLEAALAACVNMTVRMYADHHAIPLTRVVTRVELDRSLPEQARFRYSVELEGELSPEQRERLQHAARACPVRKTLSRQIVFETD